MLKIFDSHVHTFPPNVAPKACAGLSSFYDFQVQEDGTYETLENNAISAGVKGFLLFNVATNQFQVEKVNDSIAALVKKSIEHGFQTVGFAGMHQDFQDFESEILRIRSLGLRGVKIHPDIQGVNLNDPKLLPLYEILQSLDMPVYFHMGDYRKDYQCSTPDKLIDVMKQFPRLQVIAAHFGGYRSFEESVPLLKGHENLMFDTSSSLMHMSCETAEKIISTLGNENLFFGTDYPIFPVQEELHRFFSIHLSDSQRENILWNNAEKYFRLKEII